MLKGYKTYIMAGAAIVTQVALVLVGDDTWRHAVSVLVPALLALPLRSAIGVRP